MSAPTTSGTKVVALVNGPNLNLLGSRQPHLYGTTTLGEIEARCRAAAAQLGIEVESFQSNHEGALIDKIQASRSSAKGIIINPGGYAHTSVALADALAACDLPVIEVHLTNVHRREAFRRHSFVAEVADAVICGCGPHGYVLAIEHLSRLLQEAE